MKTGASKMLIQAFCGVFTSILGSGILTSQISYFSTFNRYLCGIVTIIIGVAGIYLSGLFQYAFKNR